MGKSSPSPPSPAQTAQAQAAANSAAVRESALVNQINQITPFGSETFTGTIGEPDRTRIVALDPADQTNLEAQRRIGAGLFGLGEAALLPQVQAGLGTPLGFGGLPGTLTPGEVPFNGLPPVSEAEQINFGGLPSINPAQRVDFSTLGADVAGSANELERATFQRGFNLLDPDLTRQRQDLEVQLANQGIPRGSEAFNEAVGRLERSQGRQLENLALSSVGAGRAEQSRLFGLDLAARQAGADEQSRVIALQQAARQLGLGEALAAGTEQSRVIGLEQAARQLGLGEFAQQGAEQSRAFGLQQAARQQGLSELLTQRAQPINELSALLQGGPSIQGPQFAPPAQFGVAPPDVQGAINNNFAIQSQQAQSRNRDLFGGLFGLGQAAISGEFF